MSINGCNSDGSLNVGCTDWTADPPVYGTSTCDTTECPLPSCQPDGTWCTYDADCCSRICGDSARTCGIPTPLFLDLESNSRDYDLTAAEDGVLFDIDADGDLNRVAWTDPNSAVALLALDRNGNGTIDDGAELFGNATPVVGGLAANGFEALADIDGGINSDGQIDARDPVYDRLRLWLDQNHNGVSEPDELRSLSEARITTILTAYRESRRVDRHGNRYAYRGEVRILIRRREVSRPIFDVYLTAALH